MQKAGWRSLAGVTMESDVAFALLKLIYPLANPRIEWPVQSDRNPEEAVCESKVASIRLASRNEEDSSSIPESRGRSSAKEIAEP